MPHSKCNEAFIRKVLEKTETHGGHFDTMFKGHTGRLNTMFDKLHQGAGLEPVGGSGGGGSIQGGSIQGGVLTGGSGGGGSIVEGPTNSNDPKQLYHHILGLTPRKWELMREISSQTLGAVPSPMWGDLKVGGSLLSENDRHHHENILRMPSPHGAARLVEAELGYGKGGGFTKTLSNIANKAASIYTAGHHALQFASKNRQFIDKVPFLAKHSGKINRVLDAANAIDAALYPVVRTLQATKTDKSKAMEHKLHNEASKALNEAVAEHKPDIAPLVQEGNDVRDLQRLQQQAALNTTGGKPV